VQRQRPPRDRRVAPAADVRQRLVLVADVPRRAAQPPLDGGAGLAARVDALVEAQRVALLGDVRPRGDARQDPDARDDEDEERACRDQDGRTVGEDADDVRSAGGRGQGPSSG
jgi:hypothetical protein